MLRNIAAEPLSPRPETVSHVRTGESYSPTFHRSPIGQEDPSSGRGPETTFGPLPVSLELNLGGLTTLRHHVENLLSLWCTALDTNDLGLLCELLGDASLYVDDAPVAPGSPGMKEFLHGCPPDSGTSSRIFTNLRIWCGGGFGYYSSVVQTWTLGPEWTCTNFSSYEGRLKAGPQVWRWDQHRVRTLGQRMEVPL